MAASGQCAADAIKQQEDHFVAAVEAQRLEFNALMAAQNAIMLKIAAALSDLKRPEPPNQRPMENSERERWTHIEGRSVSGDDGEGELGAG